MSPPTIPSENTGSESLSSEAKPGKPVRDIRSRAKRIGSFFFSSLKRLLGRLKKFFSRPLVVFVVLLVLLFLVMHTSVASVVSSIVAHPPGPVPKNASWIDLIIRTPVVTTMLRLVLIFGGLFVVTSLVVALFEGRLFDKFFGGWALEKREAASQAVNILEVEVERLQAELLAMTERAVRLQEMLDQERSTRADTRVRRQ